MQLATPLGPSPATKCLTSSRKWIPCRSIRDSGLPLRKGSSAPLANHPPSQQRPLPRDSCITRAAPNLSSTSFTDFFQSLSLEYQEDLLIAGGFVAALSIAATFYFALKNQNIEPSDGEDKKPMEGRQQKQAPLPPRENAVLVIGAAGRTGRQTVQQLLQKGRTVVAALRTTNKAPVLEAMSGMGIQEGVQPGGKGILFFETGVDVTRPETLKRPELWKGVSQVVIALGGKFGKQPDGSMGYIDGCTPEAVEAQGIQNLVEAMSEKLPKQANTEFQPILPLAPDQQVAMWDRMDDAIMGGQSSSVWEPAPEEGASVTRWKGDLIVEGGGFCGARTKPLQQTNWSAYDGLALRVKGDGQIFKINVKTADQVDTPESTYQATFETVDGQWADVFLPWHNFVPVKRAQSDPDGAPLDPSKIVKLGTVLSRFEFNKMPNPMYRPGPFQLLLDGGIKAFRAPKPQVVMLSSAGVERNAVVADDVERRKQQIPIVQLNPGGTLNHKYAGEIAVRSSGYPYCVVRSTGMTENMEGAPFLLEADQGDTISGAVGRDELGMLIASALSMPDSAGKTMEVRRCEAKDSRNRRGPMTHAEVTRLFLKQALDRHRWRVGLQPFPVFVPPPAPPTEERKEEIVEDVQRIRQERGVAPQTAANLQTAKQQ